MPTQAHHNGRKLVPLAAALLIALASQTALAEKHGHDMEQHGSHEHGVARLTIAATEDGLEIMLESPAANVFGFEHNAKSEAEHEVVHAALETLQDGAALFAINDAAACKLESANVESAIATRHDAEKHDEHDHDKAEKHDEHDHDKHAADKSTHSDVDATWAYHCAQPAAIDSVNVKLFSAFPQGFEEIDVEWVTASNAGKAELEQDGTVSLKP